MNTERLAVLKKVRAARKAAESILRKMSPENPSRSSLQDLVDALEDAEDLLYLQSLDKKVARLKAASNNLKAVNAKIKKDTKALQKAADRVKEAAKAIGVFAEVLSKLAALV